jgi:hypothetical protein
VSRSPTSIGCSDRCTALPGESANPLVALVIDENLQPVRQHAHTLACAYAPYWVPLPQAGMGNARKYDQETMAKVSRLFREPLGTRG